MIVINGEADDHLEMLQGGVMRQLLDDKWKTYARVKLFKHIMRGSRKFCHSGSNSATLTMFFLYFF